MNFKVFVSKHKCLWLKRNILKSQFYRFNTTISQHKKNGKTLYDLFEIDEKCSQEEIKKKYFKLASIHHPDTPTGCTIKFLEIRKAFDILSNKISPTSKFDYDSLTSMQRIDFDNVWKTEFSLNKEKIEKLNEYIKVNNTKGGIFAPLQNLYAKFKKSRYQAMIAYEEQKNSDTNSNKRHIYFILDTSGSMYGWSKIDGKDIRYISKCLTNMSEIIKYLKKTNSNAHYLYTSSLMTFASTSCIVMQLEDLNVCSKYIDALDIYSFNNGCYTHIYESLARAIDNVKEHSHLSITTFVLCTDGGDNSYKLGKFLDSKKEEMKNLNIIIVAINMHEYDTEELQQIIKAAKFGRIIHVGESFSGCGFDNINDAFSKTKDIIVSGNYIQPFNVREIFKLY